MTPKEQDDILHMVAGAAVDCEAETGVPAEVTAAQAIWESGWFNRAPKFNCFGIKATMWDSNRQLLTTTEWFTRDEANRFLAKGDGRTLQLVTPEVKNGAGRSKYKAQDWFAAYGSLTEAFNAHAKVLKAPVYADAWTAYEQSHNLDEFIKLMAVHYATDPDYGVNISKMAHGPHMTAAIVAARNARANKINPQT